MLKTIVFQNKLFNVKPLCNSIRSVARKTMENNKSFMIQSIKLCIPPLNNDKHKGQAGRIGVIGGSLEYTGAPYFAGISALKVGADLAHIFCTSSAATVIKSYSPELIVHPLLEHDDAVNQIEPWFDRLHAIVIGPGLGRDTRIMKVVHQLMIIIKDKKIPLVIDADGLFLLKQFPQVILDFQSPLILTPNKIEFERLMESYPNGLPNKNIIVFKKGVFDELISGIPEVQWKVNEGGSGRRCGGQGDLLSGAIAIFLHWTLSEKHNIKTEFDKSVMASSLACYAASMLIRRCNERAFKIKGRSMLANDMKDHIHDAFEELYGQ